MIEHGQHRAKGGRSIARPSVIAFVASSLVLAAIKLLFELYPGDFPVRGQAEAFTWPLVGAVISIGLLGFLADRALRTDRRFPEPFTDAPRERRALLIATVTGVAYGVITIARDLTGPGSGNPLTLTEWPHVPWPWSVPFYTFGAVFLEFLLRLGALCILVWLIHVIFLRRRWPMVVFWVVNIFVASYEIQPIVLKSLDARDWSAAALATLSPLYWTNVFEGWLLLRYGWVSPVVFRLAFYLVWHVIYGGLGPFR
jgi:hypothetical protein